MRYKEIIKTFLIIIFVIGTFNVAYANGGPVIGENQAKEAAQNYLDSNNLPYTAVTPGWDDLQVKVKDTKTSEVKWVPESVIPEDETFFGETSRYEVIDYWPTWIVQINDKNGENLGQIYVDANIGQVLKVVINGKALKDVLNQREQLTEDYYKSNANEDPSESAIDENISETYGDPIELIYFIDTIYPITQIFQVLPGINPGIGVIILIIVISWMYS